MLIGRSGNPDLKSTGSRSVAEYGFTLLELMVVLTLILILAAMAAPSYRIAIIRARETVLKDDLFTMRKLIDQYTLDNRRAPESLDDLVQEGYLKGGLPIDPFTGSNLTWQRVDSLLDVKVKSE